MTAAANPGRRLLDDLARIDAMPSTIAQRWANRHDTYRLARSNLRMVPFFLLLALSVLGWGAWSLAYSSDGTDRVPPAIVLVVMFGILLLIVRAMWCSGRERLREAWFGAYDEANVLFSQMRDGANPTIHMSVVPRFGHKRPMAYVEVAGGRIDIWPGADQRKPDRFIARAQKWDGLVPAYVSPVFKSLGEAYDYLLGQANLQLSV